MRVPLCFAVVVTVLALVSTAPMEGEDPVGRRPLQDAGLRKGVMVSADDHNECDCRGGACLGDNGKCFCRCKYKRDLSTLKNENPRGVDWWSL
ncbi:hypothetical protein V1264_024086 [Littorina saxatilis]|uniref:Uncharacterized protein n=1 Tax=Littorina saxatilis TaxID=31220 RepID=A0AAN9GC00_9CAEN